MGERKGTNKYYPPDYDPEKGGLNKYHGTHALRERARKLHEGILIIRFEMPYNIWCNGCGNHIGMGVRYNAQKRKMGNYYTTPIYKFRMKCHLCDQHFEIQTDPKNCDYQILSGCRRKEERWDTEKAGNVQTTDRDVKQKLLTDAMYKLEHESKDTKKSQKVAPALSRLEEIRHSWNDDFALNQLLRNRFRDEKKELKSDELADNDFKKRNNLPEGLELSKETFEDIRKAKSIRYGKTNATTLTNKRKIKESPIFDTSGNIKYTLARSLASRAKRSHTHEGLVMGELSLGVKIKKRENINALSDQGNQYGDFSKALKRISEPKERVISINPVEKTKPETISNKTSNDSKTLADNCSETALVHYASSLSGSDAEG